MITVRQVVTPSNFAVMADTLESTFWDKDPSEVTEADLSLLRYRFKCSGKDAASALKTIRSSIYKTFRVNLIGKPRIDEVKRELITIGEVNELLKKFSTRRRQCIWFALMAEEQLVDAITLTWDKVNTGRYMWPDVALDVIQAQTRHLHSRFVFWEQGLYQKKPMPLVGIEKEFERAAGQSWTEYVSSIKDFVGVDPNADAKELAAIMTI